MSEPETCALPLGITDRMRRLLGAEYPAFLASYDKPRRPALRVNPLRLDGAPDGVRVNEILYHSRTRFRVSSTKTIDFCRTMDENYRHPFSGRARRLPPCP